MIQFTKMKEYFAEVKTGVPALFKNATGTTLIDYINTIKVKNACKFLETTNKDMLEISQICGFNSSAYFSNVFKKIMKDSPSEYRQKQKNFR